MTRQQIETVLRATLEHHVATTEQGRRLADACRCQAGSPCLESLHKDDLEGLLTSIIGNLAYTVDELIHRAVKGESSWSSEADPLVAAHGMLAAARADEKEGRRLRREGRDLEAIDAYNHARALYRDSDLQFDDHGESALARDVQRSMKRCDACVQNIRHPKTKRAPATTVRPHCLGCEKKLPRFRYDGKTFDSGVPREWGSYGDNRFCGLTCAWKWACRHAPMPKESK